MQKYKESKEILKLKLIEKSNDILNKNRVLRHHNNGYLMCLRNTMSYPVNMVWSLDSTEISRSSQLHINPLHHINRSFCLKMISHSVLDQGRNQKI